MKEIIPLKKDIMFKTKISEITSINVEHDYKIFNDIVEGKLIISGTYKMTQASLIEEEFIYNIPFSIAIGPNIKKETINIEIEDFIYDIEKDFMKINAQLSFVCEKNEMDLNDYFKDEGIIKDELKKDKEIKDEIDKTVLLNEQKINEKSINSITTDIINNNDVYNTYKVYIVRENDTLESICSKYNVHLEDIKEYNDISNINIGDKIIIPYINEI